MARTAGSIEQHWTPLGIYLTGSVFFPAMCLLFAFAIVNFINEIRKQRKNCAHLASSPLLIACMALAQILHFLFGPFRTKTFLGEYFVIPHMVSDVLQSVPRAMRQGIFFLQLASFIQLQWAANLAVLQLRTHSHLVQKVAIIACLFTLLMEV